MRILHISYSFPPILNAESIQISRAVSELNSLGWEQAVLTATGPARGSRVDVNLSQGLNESIVLKRARSFENLISGDLTRAAGVYLFRKLGVLDVSSFWIKNAIKEGKKLIVDFKPEILHSWASPQSSNLVGLYLKRESNLPWVAHFSDPWSDNPYYTNISKVQRKQMRDMEHSVVKEADLIIFTNGPTLDLVMNKYPPVWRSKARIVPHGFESSLRTNKPSVRKNRRFTFVHTGNLYGLRNPETLIRAVSKLQKRSDLNIQVVFVGLVKNVVRYQALAKSLGGDLWLNFRGPVSFAQSQKAASEADAMLLIDAPAKEQSLFLPSKLVEYLQFNKPILGLTPLRGASADLLRKLGCPVIDPNDIVNTSKKILEWHRKWRTGTLKVSKSFNLVAQRYSIQATTKKLDKYLRQLLVSAASH